MQGPERVRKVDLSLERQLVVLAEPDRAGCPLSRAVEAQKYRAIERAEKKPRQRVPGDVP